MSDFDILQDVLRRVFRKPDLEVYPGLSARNVDTWDSFNHINMLLAIEEAFNVKLAVSDISKLGNVGDLVDVLNRKSGLNITFPK